MSRPLPRSAPIANAHSIEWAFGFQYATVWRFATRDEEFQILHPSTGEGWELNTDFGAAGTETSTPDWSDGSTVKQATHWRRPRPEMRPYDLDAHLREKR